LFLFSSVIINAYPVQKHQKNSSPKPRDEDGGVLLVFLVGGKLAPPSVGHPLEDGYAADVGEDVCDEGGRNGAEVFERLRERARRRQEQTDPQQDLAEIVRVARDAPQAVRDPLLGVLGIRAESGFLLIGDDSDEKTNNKKRPSKIIDLVNGLLLLLGVEDEDGRHVEEYPHGLNRPELEHQRWAVSDSVEPFVATGLHYSFEKIQTEAQTPHSHESSRDVLSEMIAASSLEAEPSQQNERRTPREIIELLRFEEG